MRNDVVHIRGLDELPLFQAFLAVGMLKNEATSQRLPSSAVASLRGRPSHLAAACVTRRLRFGLDFGVALGAGLRMGVAVAFAARHGPVTAGVSTESQEWHSSEEEKAASLNGPEKGAARSLGPEKPSENDPKVAKGLVQKGDRRPQDASPL